MPALVEFDNVTVCREDSQVLHGISFSIRAGEHVAIVGPNGGGKSTLIKAITRELYPRHSNPPGHVRLHGQEVWNLFELRALLGIVTNDLVESCVRPYTALETVLSGFFSSIGVWPNHRVTDEMRSRAMESLEFFDMGGFADRKLTAMSSGQVRRTVLARALVHEPQALVLDEPTNSLDVRAQREVRGAMRRLARAGVSVILVTHYLPDIIPEIERVIAIQEGRVAFDAPKAEALTEDRLSRLFGVRVHVRTTDEGMYQMW
jgi:iron complex transport system ATP-binding protein